jgi:hypothetical protein
MPAANTVDSTHIRSAADWSVSFLRGAIDSDWTASVPDLDMSVIEVVAHTATACLWYAIDLTAGGTDLSAVDPQVKTDGSPADVIDTLETLSALVSTVVENAAPSARGFHPMGEADPSGFAAMACDEILIHTYDAARGLGRDLAPPGNLPGLVLNRLFPWVADDTDPWLALLWANGRIAIDSRDRLAGWAWHCAPLELWDGTIPTRPH